MTAACARRSARRWPACRSPAVSISTARRPTPAVALELGAQGSPLGDLADVLTGATGIDGTLGRFELQLDGRGETLGALVRDLELELAVAACAAAATATSRAGAGRVHARRARRRRRARRAAARHARAARCSASARRSRSAAARCRRCCASALRRSKSTSAARRRRDALASRACSPARRRRAAPTSRSGWTRGAPGDLARWLGIAPESNAAARAARPRARRKRRVAPRRDDGRSSVAATLTIDAHRTGIGGKPIIVAAVRSPLIDVPELETLRAQASAPAATGTIDVPILPHGIDLADADIGLGLERVVLGRAELADVGFGARLRDGRLAPSPFAAMFAGVPFEGLVAARPAERRARSLARDVHRQDRRGCAAAPARRRGGHRRARRCAAGRGDRRAAARLRELAERSSFEARLLGGEIAVRGRVAGAGGRGSG